MLRPQLILIAFGLPAFAQSLPPDIKNFYQVDEHVYRGAQPDKEGFAYLNKLGVKTVIDLRESDARSREEQKLVEASGMKFVNIPMTGLKPPTEAEITKILGILEDASAGPVFVHCKRGADRTGAVIAAYRIDHDAWDNSKAFQEAMARGMSSFQLPRQRYIRAFERRTPTPAEKTADSTKPVTTTLP